MKRKEEKKRNLKELEFVEKQELRVLKEMIGGGGLRKESSCM